MANIEKINGARGLYYKITVSLGYRADGKKNRQKASFVPPEGMSEKKADKAAAAYALEFEKRVKDGELSVSGNMRLDEFAARWLKEYAPNVLEVGTVQKYADEINNKIVPALGHLKLKDIKPLHVQTFVNMLNSDGVRLDGKEGGYSAATIRKVFNILSGMFRVAAMWQMIPFNPCDRVTLPKMLRGVADINFFTPSQAFNFLNALEDSFDIECNTKENKANYTRIVALPFRFRVLFTLALYTGMRRGELVGLKWCDVDFENSVINISRSAAKLKGKQILKSTKTEKSSRTVAMPQTLKELLKEYKVKQSEMRLVLGSYFKDENFVFCQDNGSMLDLSTPYHAFKKFLARYNAKIEADTNLSDEEKAAALLPDISFHGLRHTSATLLIFGHVDVRTVAARLGHAQTSTTLNIYAHALRENDKRAADTLSDILEKQA